MLKGEDEDASSVYVPEQRSKNSTHRPFSLFSLFLRKKSGQLLHEKYNFYIQNYIKEPFFIEILLALLIGHLSLFLRIEVY